MNSERRLLIIFANSLDPDQAEQNVKPDLDPNCLKLEKTLAEDRRAGRNMYDDEPSRREREVNDSRHYFTIDLCWTGARPMDPQTDKYLHMDMLPTRPVGIYGPYTVFMSISFILCGHKGP